MPKYCFFSLLLILLSLNAIAQNQWRYLPNTGLHKGYGSKDTNYRIEDIYFTDRQTGFAVTLTNRLYKSTDGGTSWHLKNDTSAFNYTAYRSIEFLEDAQYGIAGSLGALAKTWRTSDYGESWSEITSAISDTSNDSDRKNICGLAHYANTFYGVGSWGSKTAKFYKSIDKGITWQTMYVDTSLAKSLVDVVFLSQDTGFVSGCRGKESVVLKTTDGGNSWRKVFGDTVLGGRIWKLQFLTRDICYGSIEPLFQVDTVAIISSTNGGDTWHIIPVGKINPSNNFAGTQGVGYITPAKGWVGGYYDGIFETVDSGKTWSHINFGYDVNRIFVIDSNNVFAGGHMPYRYSSFPNSINTIPGQSKSPHNLYPVYPNPAKELVKIEFDLSQATNVVLDVINLDGRTIYPVTKNFMAKGHYSFYWDADNAPIGNYVVWLGTNEIPIVQKFVLYK